jgi:acetyl-CoA carboxylase biotin carboxyl carrier protein
MKEKSKKTAVAARHSSGPDLAEVTGILEFMEKHSLEEFEYENGNYRIRLRKAGSHHSTAVRTFAGPPEIVVSHAASASADASSSSSGQPAALEAPIPENLHVIKSPIVGTFYASSSPGSPPFVRVGDHAESGQVLCIIEAMKLMNEIEADVAGEVMRIFVENGQPVEYGEPLFAIHPKRKQ